MSTHWTQLPADSPERLKAMKADFITRTPAERRIILQGTHNLAASRGHDYPYYRTEARILEELNAQTNP